MKAIGTTAANVRRQRRSLDLTQRQIADTLGIDQSSVSLKERGRVPFTLDQLEALADLFGVPLAALFSDASTRDVA